VRPFHRSGRAGARVTIHDRGSGIPVNVQKMMFDPFFTTKELRGSGLGLWVSRNLVANHHGTIRFRSSTRVGSSGTTFAVFLPVGALTQEKYPREAA
ncbi:MAG: HAMP domain-containing sensor histidine kinase, partial [Acidobacteriaceae bacterium]